MKNQYLSTVLKSVFCAAIIAAQAFTASAQSDWLYGCGDDMTVELEYTGINNSVPATLAFANSGSVDHVVAEIVYKGCNPGSSITIQDASNNSYTAYRVQPSGTSSNVWVYRTSIPATSSITYSNQYNESCAQSLVAYVFRQESNAGQTAGTFTERSGYNDIQTVNIPIPTDGAARDLTLFVPMSEMTTDGRYIHLSANAGGSTASVTERIYSSSLPNGCCIKVFELNLTNVPANTNTVTLTIDTRHGVHQSCNGQSWVLAAAVYTDIECVGCHNVTNAGEIGYPQTGCIPFDPAEIVSVQDPSGGIGDLEFVWLKSYNGGSNYSAISGANGLTYDPGSITQTTWYRRCSRRAGCTSYVGESNWVKITVGTSGVSVNVTGTDVSCDSDNSHECEAVHYQNGSHAIWINTLPSTGQYFKFENNSGSLVEYPDGTARITGVIYNTVETDKRWAVDVYLNDKMNWSQWQAAGGSWKGSSSIVGTNYQDWAYYEMDASQSRLIGLGYYAGKELNIQRMAAAPQFRVQVGTAANDKNGNYGASLWFDYSGDYSGHGDFNFDLQNCVDHGCDGTAMATASGGTAPYLYVWDNGATTSSLDDLCAGQYCVTVTDANGCTSDEVCVTIGEENPCCDNITDGGEIAEDQENCGPFDVAELTSVSDPSGGTGTMEIVWITRPGTSGTWQMIAGANGLTYDPGVVSTTTQFRRCARREGCTDYIGESNIITVTIYPTFELECNSSDASAWEATDGTVGIIVNGGTAPYSYLWNTGATTASISNVPAGVYSVTVTDANGCEQWTECCVKQPPMPQVCIGFRTQTPGGWGAPPNGGNPGAYLYANFATAFPSGIEIGCTNKFRFTTPQAITDFLPCGGTATGLPAGIATNPSCPGNVLAGHVLAATISVGFDNAIPSFSTSTVPLENLIVRYGTFQGWTVGDLLEEANRKLGGCSSSYSYSQLVEGVSSVNENYVDGNVTGNYLDCCSLTASCTKVDGTCSNNNQGSVSVTASGGTAPYTYAWSNGATTSSISGLAAGTYSVTVTDATGCTATCSKTVIVTPCCNVTDPGEIAASQENCGGFDPEPFTSVSLPTGGLGDIEYVWIVRTIGGSWSQIPGANGPTYDAPYTSVSLQYRRCARRSGCTSYVGESNILTITVYPNDLVANCNQTPADCAGASTGSASVSVAGGTAPYSYAWSNGATTASISGLAAGSYSVTVTDANGCTADCSATVSEPGVLSVNCSKVDGTCSNNNQASVSVSASGGTAPYTYAWSNGVTTSSISGLSAGTYSVTVTDANGCSANCSKTVTITPCCNVTDPGEIAASQENCGGFDPDPFTSVSLPTGGLGDIEYVWIVRTIGGTWSQIPGANGPTYDAPYTNVSLQYRRCARRSGCTSYVGESNILTITVYPNDLVANCSSDDVDCNGASTGSASVSVSGGTAPYSYAWSNGATTASISGLAEGTYSVTVTDANGCMADCSATVTEPGALSINCSKVDGTCSNNNQASASVSASGGTAPYSYAWSNGGTTASIDNLTAGTYSVTVTDANGCSDNCSVTVSITPCCNVTNGGQIAGGGSNCGPFDPAPITSASLPSGGLGDLEYVWLWNTQNVVNNGNSGWVEIPNSNSATYDPGMLTETRCFLRCARRSGCTTYVGESNIICFTINPEPVASCTPTNGTCSNNNQASASVAVTGGTAPYTYEWSNGATTASINGLAAGTYSVTVTDANGCTDECSTTVSITPCCNVTDPGEIAADQNNCGSFDPVEITSVSAPSGGLGDLEIVWITRPGTSGSWTVIPGATGLSYDPGVVTETTQFRRCARRSGCTNYIGESNIITITVYPNDMVANCSSDDADCNGAATGSVSVAVTGGTAPYTVLWSTGATTMSVSNLMAGSYSVTVTDANGCTTTCSTDVAEPSDLSVNCSKVDGTCSNNNQASASVSASGGTAPYSYAWSNGATTSSIDNLAAGTYSVTVTDANGCSDNCSVTVSITPCCNVNNGGQIAGGGSNCGPFDPAPITSASLPTGGLGDLEYVWLWNTQNVVNNGNSGWVEIPNSNSATYDPGMLTETRCFLRCARRSGCTAYVGESNIICFTINPEPTASCSKVDGTCANGNQASASVSVIGGTEPYTYAWSNGATTASISNLADGTYSVTVTDANGCSDNCAITVSTVPCCNVTDGGEITGEQENCGPFDPNPIVSIVPATGGIGPVEYAWYSGPCPEEEEQPSIMSPGQGAIPAGFTLIVGATGETYDPELVEETTCYIRVARNQGCTEWLGESNVISIVVNPTPNLHCLSQNGNCENGNLGYASVSVSGAPSPFSYAWSNGGTTASITGLGEGTYSVVVTDGNGCIDSCSTDVEIVPCCNVTNGGQISGGASNCGPFNPEAITSTSLPTGGLGDLEYVWLWNTEDVPNNGNNGWVEIPNSNSPTYDPGMLTESRCFLRCARRSGCSTYVGESNIICFTVYPNDMVANCTSTDVDCNGASTGSASVSVTGGTAPYSYSWSNDASTMSISNLMAGSYSVTITDANGCTTACSTDVEEPSELSVNCSKVDGTCSNNNEASVSASAAGGSEPYTYLWSNGATTATINDVAAGTYSVTVTDANGCEATCSKTVSVIPCCNVTSGGQIAGGQENCGPFNPDPITSASLPTGGLGDLEYVWLWNTQNVPNNGNSGWVEIPNSNSATYDPGMLTETRCFLRCARRSGCTTYLGESNIICMVVNDNPVVSCSSTDSNCNGSGTGTASVSVSGGEAPYTYAWSNGGTTAAISGLMAGTYSVVVTDANGCEADCSVTVSEPSGLSATCNATDANCNGETNGTLSVNATGGSAPYSYLWSNGAATATVDNVGAGSYSVTVTDANGCTATCSSTVNEPSALSASCSKVDGNCQNQNQGSASVTVNGGVEPYTVLWSTGATTMNISNLMAGSYSVTVTDANGCESTCIVTVETTPCCNVTDGGEIAGAQENCGPFDPAAITSVAPATGGIGPVEYVWLWNSQNVPINNGNNGWVEIPNSNSETYDPGYLTESRCFLRCARNQGCQTYIGESNVVCITINPVPVATCTPDNGNCNNGNVSSASVSVSGGTEPYTYLWSNGATTASIGNLADGTYSVTVTDANGCSDDCSVTVSSTPCCNVTDGGEIAGGQSNCGPFDPAAITSVAPATGGIGPVEYVWLWNSQNVPINNGNNGWVEIPNSNSETFDPGMLTESRCFIRCARNQGCETYIGESNVVCITIFDEPVATCTPVNGNCNNGNVSSASVSVSGGTAPYTYAWSNGETTASITNLADGTYSVTVTDANGCSDDCSVTVSSTPCCNVTDGGEITGSQENCGPFDPAAITSVAPATGGIGPVEYVWLWNANNVPLNNGQNGWVEIPNSNSETFDPGMLTESRCFIRCARNQGCVPYIGESNVICITINEAPVVSCSSISGDCNNGNVASASVSVTGGEGPYTYLWSNGETTASIGNLATGTYSVNVIDANGCEATCSTSVEVTGCCNVTDPGEIGYDQENCGPFDVAELVSLTDPTGGLGDLEIVWITRQGTSGPWQMIPGANGLSYDPGVVSVTTQFRRCVQRDGCNEMEESNILTITIFPQPEVVCNPTHGDCSNNGVGAVSTLISGGTAPFTYLWSNGSTDASISNLVAGDYSVTVTDANGCTADCAVTIMSEPCCNVTDGGEIAGTQENCGPFDPTAITSLAPATGGIGPVEYVWLWNTENVPNYGNNGWTLIPGATGESYDPGMLTESRCFLRCARNVGCEMFMGESNIICITVNPVPEVFCSEDDGTCSNGNIASVYATASNGTEPYAYLWSNGEATSSITDLEAGTYSVTVTDANGCEATCSKTVSITECCNVTNGGEIAGSLENCGPFDPEIITSVTSATGGLGDLEYVWMWNTENVPNYGNNGWVLIPGETGESYDPGYLTESRCFLRCARRSGCEVYVGETNVICITINPEPTAVCTPVNGTCNNGNVASASVSVSGGTEPYAYLWSNGETTASISNLADGTYSVMVTDANGCSDDCSVTVSSTPCCNVSDGGEIAGSQENCGPFDPAAITSVAPATGGIGPVEYLWLWNSQNVPINNGNNGWVEIPNSNSETYDPGMLTESRCFIRCARNEGCETYIGESNVVCITIFPALEIECSSISGDCGNGNVASASVEVLNGTEPYTYEWSNGETTAEISGLAEGTYTVTVTDANGCTAICSESVIVTPCCNVTDPGEIAGAQTNCTAFDPDPITSIAPATGGVGPVEYMWLSGACGTPVNTWTPIQGAHGESYDPGMVTETTCFIRCSRNSGCEPWIGESNIITITIQNALTIECSSISGDCGNGNVASASVEVIDGTAPFTIEWSNGETTADITGLAEGTYTVTVTDANGCTASCSESVIVTPCCNVTDPGEIAGGGSNCGAFDPDPITSVAPATGGIGPVEYMWLQGDCNTPPNSWTPIPGASGESYDPGMLTETTCFRRCARNNGCEPWIGETNIITITVYPAIELTCNGIDGDCTNGNVARAIAHISGGTEPYTISWSNGEATAVIDSLEAGTYIVTVTDVNGCEATCTTSVSVTPCCNVTDGGEIADDQENCGPFDPDPIVSVVPATGGIGPVEYAWYSGPCEESNPSFGQTAIPAGFTLIVGATEESYDPGMVDHTTCYIRVARNQGCEEWVGESNIITITINPNPVALCYSENGTCENGNLGSASVSVGGPSPFTYAWSNGETTASITGLAEGSYSVVVTDGNGCVDSCSTSVEVVPCCNVTDGGEIDGEQENCGPFDPDPIVSIVPATGGIGPVEYEWYSGPCPEVEQPSITESGEGAIPAGFTLIAGATGESYDPGLVEETTCYIRVARNQGCIDWVGESNIVSIVINAGPVVECTSENGTCENGNVGFASVFVGGPSPFTYAWSNGETTASITGLEEGTYSVVVTDGNGCVDSCSTSVEVVPCCNVTDGGEIDGEQENCGPFDPDPIVSIVPATGGIGPVEYEWYSGPCPEVEQPSITEPTQGAIPAGFTLIVGATGESYDPGLVEETTCYIRVARNQGCTDWVGESNVVSITILDIPEVEVAISGGMNPSCSGEVVELTAQSPTAIEFEWSTGATSSTVEVTEAGTYVVTVWNLNGCSATDSIEIELFEQPEVEIEVDGSTPFCDGDSVMLTAVCQSAAGYQWSTGSTGTSIWVTEAGTYQVEVVDTNGCTASTSIDVEVFELPEVEITIDGNNPLCDGDSALLVAITQEVGSLLWSNGSTSDAIWVTEAGTYTTIFVKENGCENSASVEIEEGLTPLIDVAGDTIACAGESITLSAEYAGGEGVLWSSGSTTQTIVVTEPGEYCAYTASIDGCEASACISIEFYPTPEVEVEVTAGNNPLCPGSEVELTAVSQNAVGYVWSTQETSSSITVSQAGTYSVEITDVNGCTAQGSVEVEEGLVPLIEITGETEFCTGDSVMLTAQYAGGEGVTWSTGETTQSIWVSEADEYCVLTASIDGCEAQACIEVEEAGIPEVYAGPDINICEGDETMLTATGGTSGTTYTWYVDGQEVGTGATIIVSPGVGITEYTVVAENENCSISAEDHIKVYVYEYPLAGFERDPAGDIPFGSDVQFTDTTLGPVTEWMWDFGDGLTSMLQNPDHNYDDPGSYWVTLIASNNGCADTAVAGLEVKIIIDIPNTFTPNNDGVNDVIWLQGTDIDNISMTIYNRWGHSVWASEGRQFYWSGKTTGGLDCEPGTYYYVIEMEYKDGNVSEQTGFFTLIR